MKMEQRKLFAYEIVGAFILLIVSVIMFFPNKGITGYVSMETKTHLLNLTIANSQSFILTTNSQESFYLTSLRISGEVIGNGIARAYLDNGNSQKVLIYSNIVQKNKGFSSVTGASKVTGMVIAKAKKQDDSLVIEYLENIEYEAKSLSENEEAVKVSFKEQCIESCFIGMQLNNSLSYQLLFYVEEGTILKLNEIVYTTGES